MDAGGRVFVRAPVKQVLVHEGRAVGVEMENGDKLQARRGVISNAGMSLVWLRLVVGDLCFLFCFVFSHVGFACRRSREHVFESSLRC